MNKIDNQVDIVVKEVTESKYAKLLGKFFLIAIVSFIGFFITHILVFQMSSNYTIAMISALTVGTGLAFFIWTK